MMNISTNNERQKTVMNTIENMRSKFSIEGIKSDGYSFYTVQWALNRVEAVKLGLMPKEKVGDYQKLIVKHL